MPGLVGSLIAEGQHVSELPSFIWFQGIALIAILLQVMVLLERFHMMLMQSLADRTVAYHKLKAEMQERRRLEHEVARITDASGADWEMKSTTAYVSRSRPRFCVQKR